MTDGSSADWTIDTLKAYFEVRLAAMMTLLDERAEAQRSTHQTALHTAAIAVSKAEAAVEKRLDAQNEFRAQLADQATTFITRAEYTSRHEALIVQLDGLDKRLDMAEGRSKGLSAGWVYLLGTIAAVGTLISLYVAIKH